MYVVEAAAVDEVALHVIAVIPRVPRAAQRIELGDKKGVVTLVIAAQRTDDRRRRPGALELPCFARKDDPLQLQAEDLHDYAVVEAGICALSSHAQKSSRGAPCDPGPLEPGGGKL